MEPEPVADTKPASAFASSTDSFVRFPPHRRNLLIATTSRRATALGLTLYAASRPAPLLALRALWAAARIGGSRMVPGPRELWEPPMGSATAAELCDQWSHAVGGTVDGYAVYDRPQPTRPGTVVLVCAGKRSMLVRVRRDPVSLRFERLVSDRAAMMSPHTFRVPRVIGSGATQGWHWLGYEVMATRPHAPVRQVDPHLIDDISVLVEATLVRPDGIASHWRGCHGDLSPWNLRRGRGICWLIDWEDACFAPPGADFVYFVAVRSAIARHSGVKPLRLPARYDEARQFWTERVAARPGGDAVDTLLAERLGAVLADR